MSRVALSLFAVSLLACGGVGTAELTLKVDDGDHRPVCAGLNFSVAGEALDATVAGDGSCAWTVSGVPLPDGDAPVALEIGGKGYKSLTTPIPAEVFADPNARETFEFQHLSLANDPFWGWDLAARAKAWDGVWLLEAGGMGHEEVWDVKDGKVRAFDGEREFDRAIDVRSPCEAGIDGPNGGYVATYTLRDGALLTGLGDAGERKDGRVVACVYGKTFVLDDQGCNTWSESFGSLRPEPATCEIVKTPEGEAFSAEVYGSRNVVPLVGDAIAAEQLQHTHATRFPDVASAKAALAAHR